MMKLEQTPHIYRTPERSKEDIGGEFHVGVMFPVVTKLSRAWTMVSG